MKCKSCGKEIESGLIYCPACGKAIELVPEYNVLEEELLSKIVEDKNKEKTFAEGVYKNVDTKPKDEVFKETVKPKKKSYKKAGFAFVCIIGIIALCIIFVVYSNVTGSYSYILDMAQANEVEGKYTAALEYYQKAYDMQAEDFTVVYGLGRTYYFTKNYSSAAEYLSLALKSKPENTQIYDYLLKSYDALDDSENIVKLAENAPTDEISEMISKYIVLPPDFSLDSGEFTDDITVYITSLDDDQIFYTTNNKDPKVSGKLFTSPLIIKEGTTTVKAVCLGKDGEYSDIIEREYTVSYGKPSTPEVTPAAGQYNYPISITVTVPAGGKAYYTWDGSDPAVSGTLYTGAIDIIPGKSVLSVVVFDRRGNKSPTYYGEYTYTE